MAQHHTKKLPFPEAAKNQFKTSSLYSGPGPAWEIRNDYPIRVDKKPGDSPWLKFDFKADPETYLEIVRRYCLEDMIKVDFKPQDLKPPGTQWYHAPWRHYGPDGREPLRGLTFGRNIPPRESSATQDRHIQVWTVTFINAAGATVFGNMWKDPSNPQWTEHITFPDGTARFELLFTNATDEELPNLKGAPTWKAMIAVQPDDPELKPDPTIRVEEPKEVRLLQVDVIVRDRRSVTGWMFNSFMYSGPGSGKHGYDGIIPVGLTWGNDPGLSQAAYEAGDKPKEVWINPKAEDVRINLHGVRPGWGWNGRLTGAADFFISACQSCHSTAQWNPKTNSQGTSMLPPAPVRDVRGRFLPANDTITMGWFRNILPGETVTGGDALSGDFSLQLMIGYETFKAWEAWYKRQPENENAASLPTRKGLAYRRQGPALDY